MERRAALPALLWILCICALLCGCAHGAAAHVPPRTTPALRGTPVLRASPSPVEMLEAPQIAAVLAAVRALLAENACEP